MSYNNYYKVILPRSSSSHSSESEELDESSFSIGWTLRKWSNDTDTERSKNKKKLMAGYYIYM